MLVGVGDERVRLPPLERSRERRHESEDTKAKTRKRIHFRSALDTALAAPSGSKRGASTGFTMAAHRDVCNNRITMQHENLTRQLAAVSLDRPRL
jgi:hypothetical protein